MTQPGPMSVHMPGPMRHDQFTPPGSYGALPPPPRRDHYPPGDPSNSAPAPTSPGARPSGPNTNSGTPMGMCSDGGPGGQQGVTDKDPSDALAVETEQMPCEPMTFKDFLAKQPDNISPQAAQDAFDTYLQNFTSRQPNSFFDVYKKEEWFRERYDPKYVSDRVARIELEVGERAVEFRAVWNKGSSAVCAPPLTVGESGNVESDPATPAENVKSVPNEDSKDAEYGMSDAEDKKEDEVIGNTEKELESGEEEEEKNEKPEEDKKEDLKEEEKIHETKEESKEAEKSHELSTSLCLPLRRPHQKDTIFMRGIPRNLSRAALVKALKGGSEVKEKFKLRRLKLGDINPQRSLQRFGWAVYDSEVTAVTAMEVVRGSHVNSSDIPDDLNKTTGTLCEESRKFAEDDSEASYTIDCMLNMERRRKFTEGRLLPVQFSEPIRITFDLEQAKQIMRKLDTLRKIDVKLNPLTDEFLESLPSDESRLDHVISYLREVHYFCYYSGNEFLEDPTSMPPQELRPNYESHLVQSLTEADSRTVRRVDERAKWVLERDYDRPRSGGDNGEVLRKERVQAYLEANTNRESSERYRCRLKPFKLFKAPEFVHKHIRAKHSKEILELEEKADLECYRANFENDASKSEVIQIFNDGINKMKEDGDKSKHSRNGAPINNMAAGYGPAAGSMGMFRGPMMPMGVQYAPMMMMPQTAAAGYGAGYGGPYQGAMGYAGPTGMIGVNNGYGYARGGGGRRGGGRWRRGGPPMRHHDDYDDRNRRGGAVSGGERRQRGRRYNDLDAPSDAPGMDLVRYDNI